MTRDRGLFGGADELIEVGHGLLGALDLVLDALGQALGVGIVGAGGAKQLGVDGGGRQGVVQVVNGLADGGIEGLEPVGAGLGGAARVPGANRSSPRSLHRHASSPSKIGRASCRERV